MTVRVYIDLNDSVYRALVANEEFSGVPVRKQLTTAAERAVGAANPFDEWLTSLDPDRVARERGYLPANELRKRLYDNETNKMTAYLRSKRKAATA